MLFSLIGLLGLGFLTGLVGIHYPRIIENQSLLHPVAVVQVEGARITLADGRMFELETAFPGRDRTKSWSVGSRVEIEDDGSGEVMIFGNSPRMICGTPWAKPIRIPLIPVDLDRNRREIVAFANQVKP